jgi:hypothetical protein
MRLQLAEATLLRLLEGHGAGFGARAGKSIGCSIFIRKTQTFKNG